MDVRLTTGKNAGQICEMKYADARVLLDSGRAERIDTPIAYKNQGIMYAPSVGGDHENKNARNDQASLPRGKWRNKGSK